MISVIDYGVGNLGSMLNMLRKVGIQAQAVSTPEDVDRAEKIILPGVGAFDQGMNALSERGLIQILHKKAMIDKVPMLGVCLGMQILGRRSAEGVQSGLGLIDAHCERFEFEKDGRYKVPHMGWSLLEPRRANPLLAGLDANARFYFVHSYHLVCAAQEDILATANYGVQFVAIVQRNNIYGAQFHPEKSHRFGMKLLENFGAL